MAQADLKLFIQERLLKLNPSMDVGDGSEADTAVIQPILKRIGPDPFSVDVRAFLLDLLNQNFPNMPTSPEDAITELGILPMELVVSVFTREVKRMLLTKSLQNPELLNTEEAEALGANWFKERVKGTFSKGRVRLYFTQPRDANVTPANIASTASGLGYAPNTKQGISAAQMLLNQENGYYYFDINVTAVQVGEQYAIGPNEIVQIEGVPGLARITNKGKFSPAVSEETPEEYIAEVRASLGTQSMVTEPGILAQTRDAFPEMTRMGIVGAGDPRMQRDKLTGSSLGPPLAAGSSGHTTSDNEGRLTSRRFQISTLLDPGIDFRSIPAPSTLVLTIQGPVFTGLPVRDVEVRSVVSEDTLELEDSILPLAAADLVWCLRRREIRLSSLPGGPLLPDAGGQAVLPPDTVHVGGMFDAYARGIGLDTTSLVLDHIADNKPVLSGVGADGVGSTITLTDLRLSFGYEIHDETWLALDTAVQLRYAIQIVDGPGAGTYELLRCVQTPGSSPVFTLYGTVLASFTGSRWKLLDRLNIELTDPRETLIRGADLETAQGSAEITTTALSNFNEYGVAAGHLLRVISGPNEGDYLVLEVMTAPAYSRLRLDHPLPASASNQAYEVYRRNAAGAIATPLIRLTSVELLDSSGQPTGTKVPYGAPLGAYSLGLTNPAHGTKLEVPSALLGILSNKLPTGANVNGLTLEVSVAEAGIVSVTFSGVNPISVAAMVSQINAAAGYVLAGKLGDRLIIYPINGYTEIVGSTDPSASALTALFGGRYYLNSRMIRSADFSSTTFTNLSPSLSMDYDAVVVLSGGQIGCRGLARVNPFPLSETISSPSVGLVVPTCIEVQGASFYPEQDVRLVLGARSLGVLRAYFLDPTTVEVGPDTRFTYTNGGVSFSFLPDPSFDATLFPAAPAGAKPKDGSATAGSAVLTSGMDFIRKRIRAGDVVEIDYLPITGTAVLADPVVNLAFTTLVVSFGQEAERRITFVNDSDSIPGTDVTRQGVADQINNALGVVAATINGAGHLELNPEFLLVIRPSGTSNGLLGFDTFLEQDNKSGNAGRYEVLTPSTTGATLTRALPVTESNFQFKVLRPGFQRIGATQMSLQKEAPGFYYFDVEVVSDGVGDRFNLSAGEYLDVSGDRSDGFILRTQDSNLTFSTEEQVEIVLSRTINGLGSNDDPAESVALSGRTLSLTGDGSDLISSLHTYLRADTQRDICASPLARHLTPHFVRLSLTYSEGPKDSDAQASLGTLIQSLMPSDQLETAQINAKLSQQGARAISNPITIYGVIYGQDRSVWLERSQNALNVDGLAAFYPDLLQVTRLAQ